MAIDKHTFMNALKDTLPHCIKSDNDADQTVDIIFSIIAKAIKNGDEVTLPQVGKISTKREGGQKGVSLTLDPAFRSTVNE
jgi:nucleoid DNA-binding protein